MDLKALIEKARAELPAPVDSAPVIIEVAGEVGDVVFKKLSGPAWADMIATHPPRPGTDGALGFNSDAAARDYPHDHITVDGEPVPDQGTWEATFDLQSSPTIKQLAAAVWSINQYRPQQRVVELGKARTAASTKKRRSRSSKASAPAD